jgi:hypothetical protein
MAIPLGRQAAKWLVKARHIMKIGELSSTARRSNSPAQSINQRLLNHPPVFFIAVTPTTATLAAKGALMRTSPLSPPFTSTTGSKSAGAVSLAGTQF